jgi:hypothetical protein
MGDEKSQRKIYCPILHQEKLRFLETNFQNYFKNKSISRYSKIEIINMNLNTTTKKEEQKQSLDIQIHIPNNSILHDISQNLINIIKQKKLENHFINMKTMPTILKIEEHKHLSILLEYLCSNRTIANDVLNITYSYFKDKMKKQNTLY